MAAFASFLLLLLPLQAVAELDIPRPKSPVEDHAGMLSSSASQQLRSFLQHLNRQTGSQIQIITLPSLQGQVIEQVSIDLAEKWAWGGAKEDKGALLLIARDDRQLRIEVGQGLEGRLTDAYSRRIIDDTITPFFKQGHFDQGVMAGIIEMVRYAEPDFQIDSSIASRPPSRRERNSFGLFEFFFHFFIILLFLIAHFAGFGRRRGRSGLWHLGGGGLGGGRGGGFGGGGGWSGGGGGFSGGGASGRW